LHSLNFLWLLMPFPLLLLFVLFVIFFFFVLLLFLHVVED